ncbi:MAG: glycoside hydrolase family 127 protein, partial [Clostridia bacterium]|nr:glycoside hydrolase family 127 protein [Clostridia bacterium]
MMYKEKTANFPRLSTDKLFSDYANEFSFNGYIDTATRYIEDFQLVDATLWARFVDQFRHNSDGEDFGWRGEYWGKMMRGACFTYSYTKNKALYDVLAKTVCDMIESADCDGRISSYSRECEYDGWDLWGRKYVLLGMQYFLEISDDENLNARIVKSMCAQVDYIMQRIGRKEDGKLLITKATRHWRGLNSSSILEPVVRLYTITGEQKYFDFAEYIVGLGGTDVVNVFDLAYEDKFMPSQYPVTKAYEMTSCFEGLIEFYRHTKNERFLTSVVNFANKIIETDFTIIGCCGCTSEYFDHSAVRQANTNNEKIMQETCVTVTVMKFFYQLALLTGDPRYSDAFETSLYNAYFGSINTEKVIEDTARESKARHPELVLEPLPFDSYSPLTAGTRGNGIGGYKRTRDGHYYGCCACIGSAG